MSNERPIPQIRALTFGIVSLTVIAILICAAISSTVNNQNIEELRKELRQCWSEKLNER